MNPPRVLMVISQFYPALGGAEQQALRLAGLLIDRGFSVEVLTRAMPGCAAFEHIGSVPVHRKIRTLPWGKFFGASYFLSCLWHLLRRRHSYDILHCHILQGFHSPAAVCVKLLLGKKVIVKVAMAGAISDFATQKKMLFGGAVLRLIRHADRLVAICPDIGSEALRENFSPEKIADIPNGVDTERFTPAGRQEKHEGKIIFTGALDYRKNVPLLIAAFKQLVDSGTRATLDIIGSGPELPRLEAMVRNFGLSGTVSFLGAFPEIAPYLQRAQVFALPSRYEGLPNVILEAMACGLPVVATAVGGVPDIIKNGENGLLVDSGDAGALCGALRKLLEDQDLAAELGARARQTAVERFSLASVAQRYAKLYVDLAGGQAASVRAP